jgi:hypothetical protein
MVGAMLNAQATKDRVRAIDCDPKQAAEAASRVFALNAGIAAFHANCAGGDKLAQRTTTGRLAGLRPQVPAGLRPHQQGLGRRRRQALCIDMNRDDKAHRFVVTWNAFLDGNRLAYLSLTLAIGVDLLVFMSGLFGAQALRSPLSDVPSPKARSAHQLEAIIEAALLPDVFKNARLALSALHPGNGGRLYQRGPALRARSRERLASARRAERRRDHRSGARDGHARPLPRALGAAHLPFRRRQAGAQEEAEETERGSASIGSKSASARR